MQVLWALGFQPSRVFPASARPATHGLRARYQQNLTAVAADTENNLDRHRRQRRPRFRGQNSIITLANSVKACKEEKLSNGKV